MTKKRKRNKKLLSNCCRAKVRMDGMGDFEGDKTACTMYYVCTECGNACDIYIPIRKTWTRNPKTQIIGDKRGQKERITKKEIEYYRMHEDF